MARQCKLYTELWWIDVQLHICNQDAAHALQWLQHESDQLSRKFDQLQCQTERIFTGTPRPSIQGAETDTETDNLLQDEPIGDMSAISEPAHVEQALLEYQKSSCNFQRELIDSQIAQLIGKMNAKISML